MTTNEIKSVIKNNSPLNAFNLLTAAGVGTHYNVIKKSTGGIGEVVNTTEGQRIYIGQRYNKHYYAVIHN